MRWSDPEDRADRRLRIALWSAFAIALLLPVWWWVVDTTLTAIALRASVEVVTKAISESPVPAPSHVPSQSSAPPAAREWQPVVRVLGATRNAKSISVLVDLHGATTAQTAAQICRSGGAYLATSLAGQTVRVLRWRGEQPAINAGTLLCE